MDVSYSPGTSTKWQNLGEQLKLGGLTPLTPPANRFNTAEKTMCAQRPPMAEVWTKVELSKLSGFKWSWNACPAHFIRWHGTLIQWVIKFCCRIHIVHASFASIVFLYGIVCYTAACHPWHYLITISAAWETTEQLSRKAMCLLNGFLQLTWVQES